MSKKSFIINNLNYVLLTVLAVVMAWSVYKPHDYFTWLMETFPIFIGLPLLFVTREKIPLTPLILILLLMHAIVLMIGAHYTYALVPFPEIGDRNNYDKVGHFMQGFVPAMVARELLIRTSPLKPGKWMALIICLSCLGISAVYEIIEWWAAALTGDAAESFLGTQGDEWDTPKDMLWAGIGAVTALLTLGRMHDSQLAKKN